MAARLEGTPWHSGGLLVNWGRRQCAVKGDVTAEKERFLAMLGAVTSEISSVRERACGSVVAPAVARLPASVRPPVIATLVSHRVLRPVCVGVRACVWRCACALV